MRIVFLGTGEIGVPALRALAERHDVVAVFTQPDRPAGRDLKLRPSPVKVVAGSLGLPVHQPEKIRRVASDLAALAPDLVVVAAYGQILPQDILDLPRLGCLNIHASLLPRHRGASPVHAAVRSGDAESGVTIMLMDAGLDTGDILGVARTPITDDDTAGSLHDRLAGLAAEPLLATITALEAGTARREKQDETRATYAPKLSREDGRVDWRESAEAVDMRIRGMSPWPGAFTVLPDGRMLKIHRAVPEGGRGGAAGEILAADPSSGLLVAAGSGAVRLLEVQAAGGKRLPSADFLRGNSLEPGRILGAA